MASQYQPRRFLRQMSNNLLGEYFSSQGISLGVDFEDIPQRGVEPIFKAFTSLPPKQQSMADSHFRDIDFLACEGGIEALINEASFYHDNTFAEEISAINGFHEKVMWAFLNRPKYWRGATALLHATNISAHYWRKCNNLPKVPPQVADKDIQKLEESISDYFNNREGRGRNCKVDVYRQVEQGKEYFFAYPEDFGQSEFEWEQHTLTTRARNPAFEIIFVYCLSEGSLDIYAPKNTKSIPELQKIFAKCILKLNTLPGGTIDKRVYDLAPLASPDFDFQIPVGSGIQRILVNKLRLTLKNGRRERITLEADTKQNPKAVYDLLKNISPPPFFITQASIKVEFETPQGGRSRSKSFNITYPYSCNLNHDGIDNTIRNILISSGIEPISIS